MPAHMIPPTPKEFDEKSEEGYVFDLLKSNLSEEYYIFHSVSPTVVEDGIIYEREIDFVIANKDRGILCLEAKNGANIFFDSTDRAWKYSSGKQMSHGGPYHQISSAKRTLLDKIKCHANQDVRQLEKKIKACHAVFFFKVSESRFSELESVGLPEDCDRRITLLADDIPHIENAINHVFSVKLPRDQYTHIDNRLTDAEFRLLLDSVLCPSFKLIPSPEAKDIALEYRFKQLLNEQYRILEFISELDAAVINGAAGTGKTMVAAEKARLHSINGEKVLFLCYNRLLCEYLIKSRKKSADRQTKNDFSNVDFMTISKLAKEKTGNFKDYKGLHDWLYDCVGDPSAFGYKHIVVDEGQDFGLIDSDLDAEKDDARNNCSIVDELQDVALSVGGTFCLFYDKYQMIQGSDKTNYCLPDCIQNCDCKLTLSRNCRNTKEIAKTSVTPLRNHKNKAIKPTVASSWFEPEEPVMHIVQNDIDAVKVLNKILDDYSAAHIDDVIILTAGTVEYSCIANMLKRAERQNIGYFLYEHKNNTYKVSTCKMFKGLEATAVIMLDLNKDSFLNKKGMNFYVGTSRAKRRLDLICNFAEDDFFPIVHDLDSNAPKHEDTERMKTVLGNTFSARVIVEQ